MSKVFDSIMAGLTEAVEDSERDIKQLGRRTVTIEPLKSYAPDEIKSIRRSTGLSQKAFAGAMGVSGKTIEAWEAGINHPSGAASRLLSLLEMDSSILGRFAGFKANIP